jgi:proton glutamate symport protein
MNDGMRVLLALVLGLGAGAAVAASGNPTLLHSVDFVAPIGTLWINAIRMTVIPLVVSLLVMAVASASEIRGLGRLSVRTLLVFLALMAGMALVAIPFETTLWRLLPHTSGANPLPPGAAEAASQIAGVKTQTSFGSWLVSLIPTNPIAAAANDAILPLVIFTVLFALAIARSPAAERATLLGFFRAVRDAMLVLVRAVVALAPIGIFGLVFPLAAGGGLRVAGVVGLYIVFYSAMSISMTLLLYPVAVFLGGVPLGRFARAVLPAQLVALSSSSSIAALPSLLDQADRGLGLPERIRGFVLPLAVSTFKIGAPVAWPVGALFVAQFYGIELHTSQLVTLALASVLAFAVPGIPRGAFLMLAPLFLAIGLPVEGIGILIAVDVIPDLFCTVLNTTGNFVALTLVARSAGLQSAATEPAAATAGP